MVAFITDGSESFGRAAPAAVVGTTEYDCPGEHQSIN